MLSREVLLGHVGLQAALEAWHQTATWLMLVTAVPVFVALMSGIAAPYGRYSRKGWGIFVNARFAWLVSPLGRPAVSQTSPWKLSSLMATRDYVSIQTQEIPCPLVFLWLILRSDLSSFKDNPASSRTVLASAFCTHYVYRSLIFPLIIRGGKPTPLSVWAMSFSFCIWNGFLQVKAFSISHSIW